MFFCIIEYEWLLEIAYNWIFVPQYEIFIFLAGACKLFTFIESTNSCGHTFYHLNKFSVFTFVHTD